MFHEATTKEFLAAFTRECAEVYSIGNVIADGAHVLALVQLYVHWSHSASHAGFNTLVISAVLALCAIARRYDAAAVVLTTEHHTVTGVAQKERLARYTDKSSKVHAGCAVTTDSTHRVWGH